MKKLSPSYTKLSFGGHALKKSQDCLPTLNDFFNELESQISDDILSDIMEHLQDLQVAVKEYSPLVVEDFQWYETSLSSLSHMNMWN
jgi:hypothetical protein